jgi:hypothetical protein
VSEGVKHRERVGVRDTGEIKKKRDKNEVKKE